MSNFKDVSEKFTKMKKEIEVTETIEKNKEKLRDLLFDIENLIGLLLTGEADNVDIIFKKEDVTLLITDREGPINPMDIVNRVFDEKDNMYIAKFDNTQEPGPQDPKKK